MPANIWGLDQCTYKHVVIVSFSIDTDREMPAIEIHALVKVCNYCKTVMWHEAFPCPSHINSVFGKAIFYNSADIIWFSNASDIGFFTIYLYAYVCTASRTQFDPFPYVRFVHNVLVVDGYIIVFVHHLYMMCLLWMSFYVYINVLVVDGFILLYFYIICTMCWLWMGLYYCILA